MKSVVASFAFLSVVILSNGAIAQARSATFSGRIARVWEDGFQLNTGKRSITVDSYDICGDNTARHIKAGQIATVTGEFEGGEFDAFSITKANGKRACK
ncbi:hypothetical protein [Calothrix sp. CCY 0018]|uniref:hypothetical protein n=1 Tax=Calothrix sp. CCY 0018 TaxID=3103864 RepID=UPI0039C6C793